MKTQTGCFSGTDKLILKLIWKEKIKISLYKKQVWGLILLGITVY